VTDGGGQFWAVTTCARPGLPDGYMSEFNRGRRDGFAPPFHLFIDEYFKGQAWNFLQVLEVGFASGYPRLNIFEDDVIACVGAFEFIARTPLREDAALVTWYDAQSAPGTRYGWSRHDCKSFWGLQAISIPRRTAGIILDRQVRDPWPLAHGGDVMVSRALIGMPWDRCVPSLFQHGGHVSVCNPKLGGVEIAERRSSTFLGRSFDARTLGVLT
jgi:hypothetical protein